MHSPVKNCLAWCRTEVITSVILLVKRSVVRSREVLLIQVWLSEVWHGITYSVCSIVVENSRCPYLFKVEFGSAEQGTSELSYVEFSMEAIMLPFMVE